MLPEIAIGSTIVYCSWFPGNGKEKERGGIPAHQEVSGYLGNWAQFCFRNRHTAVLSIPNRTGKVGGVRWGTSLTLSMKYSATALCRTFISLDFQSSLYWFRILSTHFFNLRAVSYFCQSFSPCRESWNTVSIRKQAEDQFQSASQGFTSMSGKWSHCTKALRLYC